MKKAYFIAAAFFALGTGAAQAQIDTDLQELYIVQSTIKVCKLKVAKSTAQNLQNMIGEFESRMSSNSREKWRSIGESLGPVIAKQKALYCAKGDLMDRINKVINSLK